MSINLDKDTVLWIAGTAIAVITAIGVFAGPIIAQKVQDLRKKRRENLRTHFEDIKRLVEGRISPWSRSLGINNFRLVYIEKSPIYKEYDFEKDDYYISFETHFKELATKWKQLNNKALVLNNRYQEVHKNIIEAFQSQGINVVDVNTNLSMGIFDTIFEPLYRHWTEVKQNKIPTIFERIDTRSEYKLGNLYASGWGSRAIAYGETAEGRDKCKSAINKVLENKELEIGALGLLDSTQVLQDEFKDFAMNLAKTIENIEKYGIERDFKKVRKCPICRQF